MGLRKARKGKSDGSSIRRDALPLIRLAHCSIILSDRVVLKEVNFALHRGERWLLTGPNGAGKTIFLKLLAGDLWPTPTGAESREYRFEGESEFEPRVSKRYICYVGPERQDKYVRYDWNFTATQVVTTGLFHEDIPRTVATASQRQFVATLLRRFGLWSLRQRKFLTLSYGQRRRTLMARAFASSPKVLLLDEVFNGLDTVSARLLRKALAGRSEAATTWVISTHRPHDVPHNATHIAAIEKGELTTQSPMRAYRITPQTAKSYPKVNSAAKVRRVRQENDGALVRLSAVNLYRDYRLVLQDVNWTIARGEHWVIVGRNGSGKSTLLKLLYGDLHPELGGSIERDGVPFGTPISAWKRRVGFVSPEMQADYFLARNIEEVVISGRYASLGLNHPATHADRRAAQRWLKFFGLSELQNRKPRAVSYGQMRLALLARAMINNPELLLLDEPFTGLDADVRSRMIGLLEQLAARGLQLVLAVHDRSELPRNITHVLAIGKAKRVSMHEN